MKSEVIVLAMLTLAGSAAMAAIVSGWFSRPKTIAEAAALKAQAGKTLDERYAAWADQVEDRLAEVERDLKAERRITRELCVYARTLRAEIIRMGGTVPPAPGDVETLLDRWR